MTALAVGVALILLAGISAFALGRWGAVSDRLFAGFLVAGAVSGLIPAIRVLAGSEIQVDICARMAKIWPSKRD